MTGLAGGDLVQIAQIAQDEFVPARRRREACRGTLTDAAKQVLWDDNAAGADSDKQDAQVIS